MVLIGCCEAVIAIFLPPLAVLMRKGCSGSLLVNILLTILGWIPGVIHAWFIIAADPGLREKHHHHSRPSHSSHGHGHHHHRHSHHGGHHSSSSHAGRHHHHHNDHHGGGRSHTGRHHARPARKSYDRPAYYDAAAPPSRYGGGAPPPMAGSGYGPPPEMGYAPPRRY